jgi:exopolysaccharide production protein ExoQ
MQGNHVPVRNIAAGSRLATSLTLDQITVQRTLYWGYRSGRPAAGVAPLPLRLARVLLFLIATCSIGNFNLALFKAGSEFFQQTVAVALWLVLIAVSGLPGALRWPGYSAGLLWPGILLLYVVVSPLWGVSPEIGALKAVTLFVVVIGTWRAALMVTVEEFFGAMTASLAFLALASLLLALFEPAIGVTHDWQHSGQWVGVFAQKQLLGISSAFLVFLTLLRLSRKVTAFDAIAFTIGIMCVVGSGSRGGAAIAVMSVICLFASRKFNVLIIALIATIGVEFVLAAALFLYFAYTGAATLDIGGYQFDLTERTLIWQFAIAAWKEQPVFGFGLDEFWNNQDVLYGFARLRGWYIDNYHNGYFAVICEAGLVGMTLFGIVVVGLIRKLISVAKRPGSRSVSFEMTLGYLLLLFTINFTETWFFRSTNFLSVAFDFLIVKLMLTATGGSPYAAARWRTRSPRG